MRWNPLDSTDGPIELAGRFAGVLETLSESSDKDKYFIDTGTTFLRHMIHHPAGGASRSPAVPDGDPTSAPPRTTRSSRWPSRSSPAPESKPSARLPICGRNGHRLAADTKSVVRSFLSNMLGPFLSAPVRHPLRGPIHGVAGAGAGRGSNRLRQFAARGQARGDRPGSSPPLSSSSSTARSCGAKDKARPSFFLCDEFQAFFTVGGGRGDADAFERTRQSNHANIVAFQNLNALYKQTDRKEPVDNLLGNCATQIFLRNTDQTTNEYASKLFGEQIESLLGVGDSIGGGADAKPVKSGRRIRAVRSQGSRGPISAARRPFPRGQRRACREHDPSWCQSSVGSEAATLENTPYCRLTPSAARTHIEQRAP